MFRLFPTAIGSLIVLACGLVHGLWTERWGLSSEYLAGQAAKLGNVATTIGEWDGEVLEMDPRQFIASEAAGALVRRYVHRSSGNEVSVLVLCGRPGPIAVHPPDVCYKAVGYKLSRPPARESIACDSGETAEFMSAKFLKGESALRQELRILWSWSATGSWKAPRNPRLTFARYKALNKLYIWQEAYGEDDLVSDDQSQEFIRLLLSELDRALFSAT